MSTEERLDPHIIKRFNIHCLKGVGAYGVVWKATDRQTNRVVAIKKCYDIFLSQEDSCKIYREIMLLNIIRHPNVTRMIDLIPSLNEKDIYIIFEYIESDLHNVIKLGLLGPIHWEYITYQIVSCLNFLHSGEVIHRDLKPSNILIDENCHIKVADFGQARTLQSNFEQLHTELMTGYIATRWYRAPEIVFEDNCYSFEIDVWGVGCILGEMITGEPLFPGENSIHQFELICNLVGTPSDGLLDDMYGRREKTIIRSLRLKKREHFKERFKGTSECCLHFLRGCLQLNPSKRLTIREALNHPFIASFRDSKAEMLMNHSIILPNVTNEDISTIRGRIDSLITLRNANNRKNTKKYILEDLGLSISYEESLTINILGLLKNTKVKQNQRVITLPNKKGLYSTYPGTKLKMNNFFQ